jgi:hypothetical protein
LRIAEKVDWRGEFALPHVFYRQKKGEQSSPNVSLKRLAGGSKLWVGLKSTL